MKKLLAVSFIFVIIASILSVPAGTDAMSVGAFEPSNSAQTIRGIENSVALNQFYAALAAVKAGRRRAPVRIVQFGDSHTAADILTGAIRKSFQQEFSNPAMGSTPGVVYEARGIIGARAVRLTSWSDSTLNANVARSQPDLIILAYGTNEVTDNNWSIESYQRMFVGILTRMRRVAPHAALLIMAPPDRTVRGRGGWQTVSRMSALIEAQRRAAIEVGAAFWNQCGAMGGVGSMNSWVAQGLGQPDHVHLTRMGYIKMGAMFYQDFMAAYSARRMPALRTQLQNLDSSPQTEDGTTPF